MMDIAWINNWIKENNYRVIKSRKDPEVVIVGETHSNKTFIEQQERLIDKLRPEYLLHECIGISTYDPLTHKEGMLKDRKFEDFVELHPFPYMVQWSEKYGLFLVGCDLSLREIEDTGKILARKFPGKYRWDAEAQMTEVLRNVPSFSFTLCDEGVIPYRDKKMGEMTVEYARKTSKPLITIMGAYHMRPKSSLYRILRNSDVGYICVNQMPKKRDS